MADSHAHDRLCRSKLHILENLSKAREILSIVFSALPPHQAAHVEAFFNANRRLAQVQQDLFDVFNLASTHYSFAAERFNDGGFGRLMAQEVLLTSGVENRMKAATPRYKRAREENVRLCQAFMLSKRTADLLPSGEEEDDEGEMAPEPVNMPG